MSLSVVVKVSAGIPLKVTIRIIEAFDGESHEESFYFLEVSIDHSLKMEH